MTLAIHKPSIAVDQILDQTFMFCKGKVNINALEAQEMLFRGTYNGSERGQSVNVKMLSFNSIAKM